MNWRHTDFQSVALPTELPRRQPHMLPHPFSSSIKPPLQCDMSPLTQSKRMYYILPQAPTLYVGPNQGKGHRSPMSCTSLHRPRRNRAVWDRSATGTRLLPKSSPTTVSPGYPLPGDGRSIDYTRHTLFHGHSRVRALSERRSTRATATRPSGGIGHDAIVPCLEAIAPPAHSTVAYLGKLPSHSDGSEDALLPPFRMAERVWDLIPFLDSPVVPLGEPQPVSDGSESALPSLRMVERVPWTDLAPHREIPSRLVHLSKGLWGRHVAVDATGIGTGAPASLPESHGPSIASPSFQPPIHPLTLSSVEGSSASNRPQQPTTHERDRLLAHTSIISHAHPFPITCAPIPGDSGKNLPGTIKQARIQPETIRNNQRLPH